MNLLEKARAKNKVETPSKIKTKPKSKPKIALKPKAMVSKQKPLVSKTTNISSPQPISANSRIIGLVGKQGTGKTYTAMSFAKKYGKALYLDGESKAQIIKDSKYPNSDIDIRSFRQVDKRYRLNKLATVQYFEKKIPFWIKELETGDYEVCVIDNCDIFRPYAKFEWLRRNPKRIKPQSFEWGEIEEIVQDLIYPFINLCRVKGIILILCYGIKDLYQKDTIVGTTEDAKQWILGEMDVEVWLEWDYKRYFLKHPYKPFWEYRDEGEFPADYFFDPEFIDENAKFKDYQQFKEETLISNETQKEIKKARKGIAISK